ncbi:mitogen-activated protein kinase-binding protein 1 isoform X8 [Drosophila gunungcola]|uniref:mitogen-activated protein kinase-binding protein 1 isoform X8 n=1 Tax=Drosophila gunungcola TaxID=103775 RepID=UPI0022E5E304|nr:mitogen-activated protein kinase-binding protein 1 isoform X8 [Drosophila gunungcola]
MRHLIMTPASLSASTPTLSTLHHQRMALQSQSLSQSPLASPLTPSPSSVFGSPKFPANYERSEKIKLKKVLGLTVCSNAALDVSPVSGLLAYPAGCTVVLFNAKRQTQAYLVNTSRKAFTSVAFSRCGRYVATGECGINPAIKVWELETPNGSLEHCSGGSVVAEFVDHKYAVTCVAFSPTGKYLVSVGSQHDMIVNVFDWRANLKMASNKISSKVAAVCFAEDGSYFVTVGNRHVKYWYLEGARKYKDPIPLMGRSAILGDLRDNDFCAVACGKGISSESTYAITRQGHLVEFSSRRLLDKWVQCRTTNANCICVNERFILVGCAESIIRIFNAATLEYVTTLPRTHYLGVDVAQGIQINHIMSVPQQAKFPDCIAMVFDEQRSKVSCVYNDHSLYIWDLRDISRVGKSHSFLYHSTCIWGVETVPYNVEREPSQTLPEECFVTCSSDDTIRVWGLDGCTNNDIYRRNIYSKELLKIVYSDEELQFIKDQGSSLFDKAGNSSYDGRNGVRCIKISPELQHLASGDRCGNIRVYSLVNLRLLTTIEAHESEVLCLEYSNEKIERKLLASASRDRLIHVFDVAQNYLLLQTLDDHSSSITSIKFVGAGLNFQMISCGADKSIMFRSFQGNIFMRGTNTSGKTTLYDMEVDSNSKHILTACQDRNVRVYGTQNAKQTKTFKGSHSDEGSLIKLSLDPSGIYVATSCTDKTLAVYDYYSSECMARMYGHSELVTGLKFTNDCRHLISASGDGCIFIWQVPHDMIVTMQARMSQQRLRSGHAPLPRPLAPISPPDGIVLESPTSEIEQPQMQPKFGVAERFSDVGQLPQWAMRKAAGDSDSGALSIPTPSGGGSTQVPAMHAASSMGNLSSSPSQQMSGLAPRPRGRWAQRSTQLETADDLRSNSESPLGTVSSVGGHSGVNVQTSDYNSASSKDITYNQTYLSEDSSIDSGMETRRGELKFIGSSNNGTVVTVSSVSSMAVSASNGAMSTGSAAAQQQRLQLPDKRLKPGLRFDTHTHDHDGDVEDISDGERTSSDHGMFYNNLAPSTPTDFKVTAMNEDELRKSVRRQKFEKSGLQLTPSALSGNGSSHTASTGTGTGTSDTEDEGSTPSAENAERSLASTLGGSSENLPQSSSNSFLHAALPEGPGLTTPMERGGSSRRSISAKHNTENGKSVAAPPTITKSYTSTKKEELLQVINKVKQQLENVGHRPLRGSHSISDLSLAANLDGSRNAGGGPGRYTKPGNPKTLNPMPIEESSIRRACSLSDLHMGNFGKPGKSNGTPQKPQAQHRNGNVSRSASKRNSLQGKTGLGASSNSMNVLNQGSDSEPEDSNRLRSASNGQGRSNGPIAANRQYSNKINNVNNNRRKTPNFSSATPMQDDSSSEETPNSTVNNKPIVPPRPRNLAFDHKSKLMINNIGSPGGNASKQRSGVTSTEDYEGTDPEAQVHNVINKLYTTTQAAMQLHANLKNSLLLKELENALIMSRNMLSSIPNRQAEKTNNGASGMGGGMGVGVGGGGGLNHDQLSADNGDYLMMVNNCADLLSNLRTKHKPDDCENNS